ncbi:uncharacterized protein LOC134528337 [Bacillus rossius redtenbacheri]|uniref:uncharacterized protein LOC134528337 n=1 Tax=Bacillus rossius redtenbacheri TaxID=93214 RepID=UPI002FDD89F3
MPKRRSDVWYHFTHQELSRATCNYCKALLSYSGGSTGNLARHLKKRHQVIQVERPVPATTTIQGLLRSFPFEETPEMKEPEAEADGGRDEDAKPGARKKAALTTSSALAELMRLCKACESSAATKQQLEELKVQQMKELHDMKMKILQTDLKIKEELLGNIKNGSLPIQDAIRYLELHDS